jgi:cell fate regulator YaaT (PSP1 superfamily)
MATKEDYQRYLELTSMEEEALVLCREKVQAHGLDMKLVSAHYLFGESKIIFFFTAANRVDFRDLVKDLVGVFRIRIELRQIGVRDESRVLGGLAVCGRDFCCHAITDKLNPVSIKMAKEQNLSLNSTKISGPCGRLLCCLSYEYDFYAEEKRKFPAEGSRLKVQHELMKITEVNILSRKISLVGPEGRHLTIPFTAVHLNEETSRWEIDREYLDEFLAN